MNENVVNKKSFISQVTEIVKTNIRNIIILLSLSFVLFLSYQIYSFYIYNPIYIPLSRTQMGILIFIAYNN